MNISNAALDIQYADILGPLNIQTYLWESWTQWENRFEQQIQNSDKTNYDTNDGYYDDAKAGTDYSYGAPEFTPGFSGVRVDRCLSFCPFSFGHCFVCTSASSIYGFSSLVSSDSSSCNTLLKLIEHENSNFESR